jgi:hypothetical protein
MFIRTYFVLPALCALAAGAASAQTAAPPVDAGKRSSGIDYRSAFTGYRPYREVTADWRSANDAVGALKGHGGHTGAAIGAVDANAEERKTQPASEHDRSRHAHDGGQP